MRINSILVCQKIRVFTCVRLFIDFKPLIRPIFKACTWDDSIVTDTDVEFARRMQMVAAGMMKHEAVYAWYFGCSEEEALKHMPPKMAAVEE